MYIVEKPYEIVCIQLNYLIEAIIEICFGTDFLSYENAFITIFEKYMLFQG